ncbi:hypothetical protein [Nodosilinea sp. FACHB-13]|uniref:hypothetical protein n=1 Tax=Cyanophyceae TaxID=3028117 RepID=UPI001686DEC8|nr:hypothetical protein [Nodosilinea sp. FACHB-13]MBD2106769.1 hypothetical protein [Nodosilinea sp. FACHB-13]
MASSDKSIGAEFLLAEFNAIQQRAVQIEQSKASSVNFYLVIVAATIASIPGVLSLMPKEAARYIVIGTFSFILIVGLLTLDHSVNQAINIIRLYRRAGKVRRYFLDQAENIKLYLPFEANDSLPRINLPSSLAYRGAEVTVFAINVASVAIIFAALFSSISWIWASIVGTAVGGTAWILQKMYFRRKLEYFEKIANLKVTFPINLQ